MPVPEVDSLRQMNGQLQARCQQDLAERPRGKSSTKAELLAKSAPPDGDEINLVGGTDRFEDVATSASPSEFEGICRPSTSTKASSPSRCCKSWASERRSSERTVGSSAVCIRQQIARSNIHCGSSSVATSSCPSNRQRNTLRPLRTTPSTIWIRRPCQGCQG